MGMVVVVQFLAPDEKPPGNNIGGGVRNLIVAITPIVPDAIDYTGSRNRYP